MTFENTEVWGFKGAIRGIRNSMASWDKADSKTEDGRTIIGPEDMKLAQHLVRAGSSERKFLRQIIVSADIRAPLYWWKEFDQYKIGTTTNSESTMHTLLKNPITIDCFEHQKEVPLRFIENIKALENLREATNALENVQGDKKSETPTYSLWLELIQELPESWLQMRTTTMTYENIYNICQQRKRHKLDEWEKFIDWAGTLPYVSELFL